MSRVADIKKLLAEAKQHVDERYAIADQNRPTVEIGTRKLDDIAGRAVKSPLVSFVLINFNYAEFIGETIESIKRQDYQYFECIVIDNYSSDDSVRIINEHIANDPRFILYELPRNLGQLGASIWAIDRIHGSFVVFVDSDDILFPSFCSSHVQAHLALGENVLLTSSNLVEIDQSGHLLTGRSSRMDAGTLGLDKGFRALSLVPRLSTVDDAAYKELEQRCAVVPINFDRWCLTPGTSNMYRTSFIRFFQIDDNVSVPNCSNDGYFKLIARGTAPTAIIDLPLSAYRIHGGNYWSVSESISGLKQFTIKYAETSKCNYRQTLEIILSRAVELHWLTGNLWTLIDSIIKKIQSEEMHGGRRSTFVLNLFKTYNSNIENAVGERSFDEQIAHRFGIIEGLFIVLSPYSGWRLPRAFRFFLRSFLRQS